MAIHQPLAGRGGISRIANQLDDRVEIIEGHKQALEDVIALLGFAQQVLGAPFNRLDAEVKEHLKHSLEVEHHRLTLHQGQHVGAEVVLKRGEFVEVVEHNLRVGITAQFDHDAHAIAVAFIADVGDAFELLVVDELSDALNQGRLVGLIRQLGDDHRIAIGAPFGLNRLDRRDTAHGDRTTAAGVGLADALAAQNLPTRREVRPRDDRHQLTLFDLGIGDQRQNTINQLPEVVGRDVGCHADSNAG